MRIIWGLIKTYEGGGRFGSVDSFSMTPRNINSKYTPRFVQKLQNTRPDTMIFTGGPTARKTCLKSDDKIKDYFKSRSHFRLFKVD